MTQFRYTEKSKSIDSVMKDFKVVPYPEVSKTLDEATRKTLQAYYEAKAVSGQNNTPKKAAAGQNKTLKKSKA